MDEYVQYAKDTSFRDEIMKEPEAGDKQEYFRKRKIESAMESSHWKFIEETIWPKIQEHLKLSKLRDGRVLDNYYIVENWHHTDHDFDTKMEILVIFVQLKGFLCERRYVIGHNYGYHVSIGIPFP